MEDTSFHGNFYVRRDIKFCNAMINSLQRMQQSSILTDFKVKVESKVINCHKVILAAASPFFDQMFDSQIEKNDIVQEIKVSNNTYRVMSQVINYLYSGEITLEYINMKDMIEACDYLKLPELMARCESYVLDELNPKNCLDWWRIGKIFELENLTQKAQALMHSNFNQVTTSKEFYELDIYEVFEYINDKNLKVQSENSVLGACMDWVKFDAKKRQEHVPAIVENIKLEKCSLAFLQKMVETYKDILDPKIKDEILRSFMNASTAKEQFFHSFIGLSSPKGNTISHEMTEASQKCIVIAGGEIKDGYPNTGVFLCDAEDMRKWKQISTLPQEATDIYISVCQVPEGFLVTGGRSKQKACHLYDQHLHSWLRLLNLQMEHLNHGSLCIDNTVYMFGGVGPKYTPTFLVEVLDLQTKRQKYCRRMNHAPGIQPISAKSHDTLYVILNSCRANTEIRQKHGISIQAYDTMKDKWTVGTSLPDKVKSSTGASAIVFKDFLYIVGGRANLCAKYCLQTGEWTILENNPFPCSYGSINILGDKIFLFGGASDDALQNFTDRILEYEIEEGEWIQRPERLPISVAYCFALTTFETNSFLIRMNLNDTSEIAAASASPSPAAAAAAPKSTKKGLLSFDHMPKAPKRKKDKKKGSKDSTDTKASQSSKELKDAEPDNKPESPPPSNSDHSPKPKTITIHKVPSPKPKTITIHRPESKSITIHKVPSGEDKSNDTSSTSKSKEGFAAFVEAKPSKDSGKKSKKSKKSKSLW